MKKHILILITILGVFVNQNLIMGQEKSHEINLSYDFILFDFNHSMRIPNNSVTIKIEKRLNGNNNSVTITVKSKPMESKETEWKHTIIDKKFELSTSEYSDILSEILKVNANDIYQGVGTGGFGHDGTTCKIEFGSSNSSIAYSVWSPDYDTSKRKLDQFLKCCNEIIILGGLQPEDLL